MRKERKHYTAEEKVAVLRRENRAMAQVTKERVHPAWNTAFAG